MHRYCCSNVLLKFDEEQQFKCNLLDGRTSGSSHVNYLQFRADFDDYIESGPSFGTVVAIGVTLFAVVVVTIILCLTCSCCCLYKACRRPQPVVTATTTATTVVHAPYPQQPAVPAGYPAAPYQGYQPVAVQPQPGMPIAPYPTQYPPPYPTQPSGPPAYHETVAAGAGAPYPVSQPPYNPAYVDPQKPIY
ncbi:protein shisa-5 isoform X2 [Apteryx mantelli]